MSLLYQVLVPSAALALSLPDVVAAVTNRHSDWNDLRVFLAAFSQMYFPAALSHRLPTHMVVIRWGLRHGAGNLPPGNDLNIRDFGMVALNLSSRLFPEEPL